MFEDIRDEQKRTVEQLKMLKPGNAEYDAMVQSINKLLELEVAANKAEPSTLEKIVNNGPLLNLIGGVVGTILIINHERINVVTSRAFNFIKFK